MSHGLLKVANLALTPLCINKIPINIHSIYHCNVKSRHKLAQRWHGSWKSTPNVPEFLVCRVDTAPSSLIAITELGVHIIWHVRHLNMSPMMSCFYLISGELLSPRSTKANFAQDNMGSFLCPYYGQKSSPSVTRVTQTKDL